MLLSLTLNHALALDCTGLNLESCSAANTLATQVNEVAGSSVITDDAAQARFRTLSIYDEVETIRGVAVANGCEVASVSFAGSQGGTYRRGSWTADWDGLVAPAGTGAADGEYAAGAWTGTYDGAEVGDFGTVFAVYNAAGQVAGDREGDFLMGVWLRTGGRRGVHATVFGTCAGAIDEAFSDWYEGDLPEGPGEPEPQPLMNFASSFSQGGFSAGGAIDGSLVNGTGWAINPQEGSAQTAVFELTVDSPSYGTGTEATFLLQHRFGTEHLLGCIELYTTDADRTSFADGAGQIGDPSIWTEVSVTSAVASNGAATSITSPNRVVVQDLNSTVADYTIVTETDQTEITGIRVDACKDASLPSSGPGTQNVNGNFVLTEIGFSTRAQ